jgi:hypothetical protein
MSHLLSHDRALQSLEDTLAGLRGGHMDIHAFCTAWRAQKPLLEALPPRYATVMEDLLGRLEAGSLFTEESCSFSQADLLSSLATWLAKARQTLADTAGG